jgi:hypothetical protein
MDVPGVYVATTVGSVDGRKTYKLTVPWQEHFESGATLQLSDSAPRLTIKFQLSKDAAAASRPTVISFSVPSAFVADTIEFRKLQIVAFIKKKPRKTTHAPPPTEPLPVDQTRGRTPRPQSRKRKPESPVPKQPEIAADATFIPPAGTVVLPCPDEVTMASLKGRLICHRFDKETWREVFALGGKALRISHDGAFFEVKYPGYRELYLHELTIASYGANATWCLYG